MFIERGYLGTSLDDIAGALGSTKGRIYHYFSSKADLYLAVHHAAMRMMIDEITPFVELAVPPTERLRQMVACQLRMIMQAGPIQKSGMVGLQRRTIRMTTVRQKRALAAVLRMRDQYEEMFANVILDGIATGEFTDLPVKILTKPLQGAINYSHVWFDPTRTKSAEELERLIGFITDYVVGGVLARPAVAATVAPQQPAPARITPAPRSGRKSAA